MEDNQERIIQFIRMRGPVIPVEVSKHINTNILIASANLSELSSDGRVKISNVKIGGSPLYYLPGQEPMLQRFAENLNEKDKRAYELLLQKRVLRDNELEPLMRVALRAIKDYAVPLQVNFKGNSEIFWKWHLLTNKEAEESIRAVLKEPEKDASRPAETETQKKAEEESIAKKEEPEKIERKEEQKEVQRKIAEKPIEKRIIKREKDARDEFAEQSTGYFSRNKIEVLSREPIRKGEIDFIVKIPSALGNLEYYCKARKKKTINDSDLASAFVQGQLRKLPVLLLTDGELTKRAKEMLQKDFKGMSVMKI